MALVCNVCRKSYSHRQSLYRHRRREHEGKRWTCDECDAVYTRKDRLARHRKSHLDIPCSDTATSSESLGAPVPSPTSISSRSRRESPHYSTVEPLLSSDKVVSTSVHENQRYFHVQHILKECVALTPAEWETFLHIMADIDRSKDQGRWDLSDRAFVWKKPDGSVHLGLWARVWNSNGDAPLPEKTVTLYPAEWYHLLSMAPTV